jgi:hypothetical protein
MQSGKGQWRIDETHSIPFLVIQEWEGYSKLQMDIGKASAARLHFSLRCCTFEDQQGSELPKRAP